MDQDTARLFGIFQKNPQDLETFKSLEEYYFLANAWTELASIYKLRAQAVEKSNVAESAQLYFQQAECLEKRLGRGAEALESYIKAYSLAKENPKYLQAALDIAEGTQNWSKVAEILKDKIQQTSDRSVKAKLFLKLAICMKDRLRNLEEAKLLLLQSLDLEEIPQTIQLLESIYLEAKAWDALLEIYQTLAQKAKDKKDKIARFQQCAHICEENLQDIPQAIEFYESILKISPNEITSLQKLEALYSKIEKWDAMVAVMERQLALLSTPDQKVKLLNTMALVWQKVNDLQKASAC